MTGPRLDPVLDPLTQYLQRTVPRPQPRQDPDAYLRALRAMLEQSPELQRQTAERLRQTMQGQEARPVRPRAVAPADMTAPSAGPQVTVGRTLADGLQAMRAPLAKMLPANMDELRDVGRVSAGAALDVGGMFAEGAARAVGNEPQAAAFQDKRAAIREELGPTTRYGQLAQIPAALAANAAPFVAAGFGAAPMLTSAGLTGVASQAEGGSFSGALGVEDPAARAALDIGTDLTLGMAGPALGALRRGQPAMQALGQTMRSELASMGRVPVGLSTRDVSQEAAERAGQTMAGAPLGQAGPDALAPRQGPAAVTQPSIAQEVRSKGRYGYVQVPEGYVTNVPVEQEHVARLTQRVEPLLSSPTAPVESVVDGAGLFGGEVSPNTLLRFSADADDAGIRRQAAMRGIVYGQDQQLWYRPLAQPGENTTAGLVLTGPDEGALSDQVIEEVLSRARADDILGPYGGATRDGNHLLFLNLKNYTGMEDAEFLARIERMIDDVQSAGDIDKHIGTFYAEEMNGTPAYLRALAGDPDAIRAARAALEQSADEYARYADLVGADRGVTEQRLAERIGDLDRLIEQLDNPPPVGKTKGLPLAQVAAKVNTFFAPLTKQEQKVQVPVMADRLHAMVDDMVAQGVIPRDLAQDWYGGATKQQTAIARLAIPELREDAKAGLYHVVNSILSSGQQVPVESQVGLNLFDQYLRTGRFSTLDPTAPGYAGAYLTTGTEKGLKGERAVGLLGDLSPAAPRTINHEQALQRLDALVQAYGEQGAMDVMLGTVPFKVKGEVVERPAMIHLFGPKIGRYMMDKMGLPGDGLSTIDLWMARLYYMLRGDNSNVAGSKLNDAVTPEMRRTMQAVLADYATRFDMPESSAQAIAWYAIKNAFGNAGAREKAKAYATLGSATADALLTTGKRYQDPIRQGYQRLTPQQEAAWSDKLEQLLEGTPATAKQAAKMEKDLQGLMKRGKVYGQHETREGWHDPKLRDFAKRIGRPGTIRPEAGAFAGRVYGITGLGVGAGAVGGREDERPADRRGVQPLGRRP